MRSLLAVVATCSLAPLPCAAAVSPKTYYEISNVPLPAGVDPQVGGLAALPDGRVVACLHHGEVEILDPATRTWTRFAEGLHEPLGVLPEADGSLLIMQRAELTRLRDRDRDGRADDYETVWDDFGLSGNYHEFAFGPVRGPDGRLYVALNLASGLGTVSREVRGRWSDIGVPREEFYTEGDWSKMTPKVGRMFSRVAWRGWVMAIDPASGRATPFASGFRSPDGLGLDESGTLFVNDNQGDWRGTSEVFAVRQGGFYGHPASLVWRQDWDGSEPLKQSTVTLNALRTPAAIYLPYGSYAHSPTQMLTLPRTPAWGPFGGQLIVGEMNSPKLLRLLPEEVEGTWQGACITFIDTPELRPGLHRMAFAGDTLYLGRIHLSWAGGEGLGMVRPRGITPPDVLSMRAAPRGFTFTFTHPVTAAANDATLWKVERYRYHYGHAYGSPKLDRAALTPARVTLSADRLQAEVEFTEMPAGFVYDFDLTGLVGAGDAALLNPRIAYTLHRLPAAAATLPTAKPAGE